MQSAGDVGAFRQFGRNMILPGTPPEAIRVAEMSAAEFRVARVPLTCRALDDRDEREETPPVVVIDYQTWTTRFQGLSGS